MERETGIEPATNGLGSRYSTIELLPRGEPLLARVNGPVTGEQETPNKTVRPHRT